MTLPANVRVNAQIPFPALVTGSGPITIGKTNGIWTVGYSVNGFGVQVPPVGLYTTDYVLVWDSIAKTFFNVPLSGLPGGSSAGGIRLQRSVTASPIVIAAADQVLNCNIAAPATCALPASASRAGLAITFKDLGQAGTNTITITPNGTETIDGVNAPVVIDHNYGWLTLVPFNDGVNMGGWTIQ